MGCLYILKINPLSIALFANIFSCSEGCLFILFMIACAVQKLLSFIRSHLFIFVFIFLTVGGESKRILLWFISKSVLPMFFSKSFIVSGLIFRPLILCEFIFVCGIRQCSNFTFICSCPVYPAPLNKEAVFSTLYILAFSVKDKVFMGV